jgi:hypothetical protein
MKRRSLPVALIWFYRGKDASARKREIENFDYGDFEVIEVNEARPWSHAIKAISDETEVCIFWVDDDKPVSKSFLKEMTQPLANQELRAVMHYWSGNAFSLPKDMLNAFSLTQDNPSAVPSLLQLLLPVLDTAEPQLNGRIHLAFSSTERLAPLSMEPVGFPS